jgi:hypothetical protein
MLAMQTLGLSDSTPRSEGILKSLLWPSIQSGADVDYLGIQGYWVCTLIAVTTFLFALTAGHPILGVLFTAFFYLGGVGVRERSLFAAVVVLAYYLLDSMVAVAFLLGTPATFVIRALFTALLLSNLRAAWLISHWKADAEEAALPPRPPGNWKDTFAGSWPAWLWPKVRVVYYVFAACVLVIALAGIIVTLARRFH